jgi:hypothetical protein
VATVWLWRATLQNIVIGGYAGARPGAGWPRSATASIRIAAAVLDFSPDAATGALATPGAMSAGSRSMLGDARRQFTRLHVMLYTPILSSSRCCHLTGMTA